MYRLGQVELPAPKFLPLCVSADGGHRGGCPRMGRAEEGTRRPLLWGTHGKYAQCSSVNWPPQPLGQGSTLDKGSQLLLDSSASKVRGSENRHGFQSHPCGGGCGFQHVLLGSQPALDFPSDCCPVDFELQYQIWRWLNSSQQGRKPIFWNKFSIYVFITCLFL